MSPADIQRYGYFIGTSLTYNLDQLEKDHLIERINGLVSSDRRRRPVKLTSAGRRMAASIRIILAKTAQAPAISQASHIDDEPDLYRIGKSAAGRLLDGHEHNEIPQVRR